MRYDLSQIAFDTLGPVVGFLHTPTTGDQYVQRNERSSTRLARTDSVKIQTSSAVAVKHRGSPRDRSGTTPRHRGPVHVRPIGKVQRHGGRLGGTLAGGKLLRVAAQTVQPKASTNGADAAASSTNA